MCFPGAVHRVPGSRQRRRDVCCKCWIESHRCSHLAILHLNVICHQLLRPGLVMDEGQMESHLPILSHSVWVRSLVHLACLLRVSQGQNQVLGQPALTETLVGIIHL